MDFKFKTTFSSQASILHKERKDFESFSAFASAARDISGLSGLFPTKEEVDKNPDLLYVSFNLAVANQANLNDDACLTADVIEMAKNIKYKQFNIEHDRSELVGCLTSASFSTYAESKLISEEDAATLNTPFNLAASAVIWRVVGDIDQIVEACDDPDSPHYRAISTSFEVGFNSFSIALNSRNLAYATIIDDEAEVEKLSKYLRCNGGKGITPDGQAVYRVIKNPIILGAGIVLEPAADVNGILTYKESVAEFVPVLIEVETPETDVEESEMEDSEDEETKTIKIELEIEVSASEKNIEKSENLISYLNKPLVNQISNMKITDLKSAIAAIQGVDSEAFASKEVCDLITSEIAKANDLYVAEQTLKAEAEASLTDALAKASEAEAKLEELSVRLEQMESQASEKARQDIFDARFTSLAEVYDLDNAKLRSLVAKQIRDLDDEAFEAWKQEDGLVILAGKEKEKTPVNIEEATELMKEAQASVIDLPNAQDLADPTPFNILDLGNLIEIKA